MSTGCEVRMCEILQPSADPRLLHEFLCAIRIDALVHVPRFRTPLLLVERAEVQPAFMRVILVPVHEEEFDLGDQIELPVAQSHRGGLTFLALRSLGPVKALLGEREGAWLAFVEEALLMEKGREHFEVLEGDLRSVDPEQGVAIVPEARVKEIRGIGMVRERPGKVSLALGEGIQPSSS